MAIDKNKCLAAATKYLQKRQYEKAIKEYQKIEKEDPNNTRILMKIAETYMIAKNTEKATEYYLKVAKKFQQEGFFPKVVAIYKQIIKLDPSNIDVTKKLATLYTEMGLIGEALKQYNNIINDYIRRKDYKRAKETIQKMLQISPNNISVNIRLADIYVLENDIERAKHLYSRIAKFLVEKGKIDEYLLIVDRLVRIEPDNLNHIKNAARTLLKMGYPKQAIVKLQTGYQKNPEDIDILSLLAEAFYQLGQVTKVASIYKELARIFKQQNRIDKTQEIYKKLLQILPDDPEAAKIMEKIKGEDAAKLPESDLKKQEARDSNMKKRTITLQAAGSSTKKPKAQRKEQMLFEAQSYIKLNLKEKACNLLEELLKSYPDDPEIFKLLIELYLDLKDFINATDKIFQAANILPKEELRDFIERALKDDPENPRLKEALSALESGRELKKRDDVLKDQDIEIEIGMQDGNLDDDFILDDIDIVEE